MSIARNFYPLVLLCLMIALAGVFAPCDISRVQAAQRTLSWSVVDTPANGPPTGMIIRPCGINDLALGVDGRTFYAVDTANNGFYKSGDAGYSWTGNLAASLSNPLTNPVPASLPVWNVVVAPDNANIVLAVTDGGGATPGPKKLYYTSDGGENWQNTSLPLLANDEYIGCLTISLPYGAGNQTRDIAVGTRITTLGPSVAGRLFTCSNTFPGGWQNQILAPSFIPASTGVTSVKFSPSYAGDQTIAVISCTAASTWLHLGKHDSNLNATTWNTGYAGYPLNLNFSNSTTIINSNLELPAFYNGDIGRGCFISIRTNLASVVLYINNSGSVFIITPQPFASRISSISYNSASGILLAGEAMTSNPALPWAVVWQSPNAQVLSSYAATWHSPNTYKSPTGGGNTGRATALVAWSADSAMAYCGTSSEATTIGGTGAWVLTRWPRSKMVSVPRDESAFSYSADQGATWNQIGIINTVINRLSDTAAYEQTVDEATGEVSGINALYLASINRDIPGSIGFDSVWRSSSDPLGYAWERILTGPTLDGGMILRINPRDDGTALVLADTGTDTVLYTPDEGNSWSRLYPGLPVIDISLLDDITMYVLGEYTVRKLPVSGLPGPPVETDLLMPGHTICTSLNPSTGSDGEAQEIVVIGTGGEEDCYVAWADFKKTVPKFTQLKIMPAQGDVHVIMDDLFESNWNIYAGVTTNLHDDGNIYRWTIGTDTTQDTIYQLDGGGNAEHKKSRLESTDWDILDPLNRSFFGLCMLNEVLYGAWNTDMITPFSSTGVDRTLEARIKVPPPPDWDELRDGLPDTYPNFTCEPVSLHASSNSYNTLWAIDNQDYDFPSQQGCLWSYVDSVAMLHPWPTAPPLAGFIGADPVTGRSQQIDFKWRPLRDIFGYDLLIAKDADFTLLLSREVSQALSMIPLDDRTGAWIVTPADQESPACWIAPGVLEAGRPYFWKVRGSRSVENTTIHSPWSQAMFFSVKPGFPVTSGNMGPTLLAPVDGICGNCQPPMRFSWSPIKNATTYEFILAEDAQLSEVIVSYITHSTAYEYRSKLQLNKAYYWQVKAVAPVISDPSPVGTFSLSDNNLAPLNALLSAVNSVKALPGLWTGIIIVAFAVLLFVILTCILISRRRY